VPRPYAVHAGERHVAVLVTFTASRAYDGFFLPHDPKRIRHRIRMRGGHRVIVHTLVTSAQHG
jgi:hypothetical protein